MRTRGRRTVALVEIARERGDPNPPMTLCMNVHRLPADSDETHRSVRHLSPSNLTVSISSLRWDMNLLLRQLSTTAIAGWLMYGVDCSTSPPRAHMFASSSALVDAATSVRFTYFSDCTRSVRRRGIVGQRRSRRRPRFGVTRLSERIGGWSIAGSRTDGRR